MLSAAAYSTAWRRLWRGAILATAAAGLWWAFWWHHVKRFQAVESGVLYRTAQPTEFGLWYLARRHGVRTVINLRLEDPKLLGGIVDFNQPDGCRESEQVARLGLRLVSWPMGEEACWPWLSGWQFGEFFKFFDDPANLPAAMHCVGGRHRTGTIAALYRMEYDGWPAERAIEEMLSFSFGPPVPIQDQNLRTYTPRPRPSAGELAAMQRYFAAVLSEERGAGIAERGAQDNPLQDYATLVRGLRASLCVAGDDSSAAESSTPRRLVAEFMATRQPFSLPLAQRIIDDPQTPLAELAAGCAVECLLNEDSSERDWTAAAALVADFGDSEQQLRLLDILSSEPLDLPPTARYRAVVAGVTNRYTANRIPFLRPLLSDRRYRPEPEASTFRYCDTAAARLSAIQDVNFLLPSWTWDEGVVHSQAWMDVTPEAQHLTRLRLPDNGKAATQVASPADLDRVFQRR